MRIATATTISITAYTFVLPIANGLRARGDEVTFLCSDETEQEGRSFVEEIRGNGFPVHVIPMSRRINPLADLRAIVGFYRFFRSHPVDLLHTQTAKAGMIGRVAAKLAGVPVIVYTAHAFSFHDYLPAWRRTLYAALERFAARLCNVIVVDSADVRDRGVRFGLPAEKLRVIPMGVDTNRYSPLQRAELRDEARRKLGIPPEAAAVGLAARFVPDKGLDTFVEAAAIIARAHPETVFVMVGDGPLRPRIEEWIAHHGLSSSFRLPGMQSRVEPFYAAMDVFMLPTLREGFGVAFCEALSMEVPVVATRIAPLTDIVLEGETGLLADPGDASAFAAAAIRLIESPSLRRSIGTRGRARVLEHFSVQRMVSEHESLFDGLSTGERR